MLDKRQTKGVGPAGRDAPTLQSSPKLPRRLSPRAEFPTLAPGDRVAGRYRVDRLLGRGGTGEVYEATDEELAIAVALKALRLDLAREPRGLRSLKQEVLLARSITHPHVCRVYDLGRHEGNADVVWFLTMELLRGETLAERFRRRGRMSEAEALPLVEQMVSGLSAAHRAGVIHLDFKSGNVMVVEGESGGGERVVVTDFGLARTAVEETLPAREEGTTTSDMSGWVGTPAYMAPEQVHGLKAGPAADIYALGVVLYEMMTGQLPFSARSPQAAVRRLEEGPAPPSTLVANLGGRWEAVILRCLARQPEARFSRIEEVVEALLGREVVDAPSGMLAGAQPARFVLPDERDAFVGREAEIQELNRRIGGGARLVTLLGAAGMGKTRLVVRYGWQSLSNWPGGVWFCDLTGAESVEDIVTAVGGALGVPLGKGEPVIQLGHAIAGRGKCLVILDNFEQVAEHAGATVGRWLERASEARFVVTSRQRLMVLGEEMQLVEPLGTEAGVELFVERAARQRPGFEPSGKELESVREVVALVEGMPLGIELAAARVRVMAVEQVVERMRERWRVLGGGGEGRHGSLVAAIEESWDLLNQWERAAWAQCSVFEGGFTLEAAEAVLDLSAWPEAPWAVDVVQALVDKSLLRMWAPERGAVGEAPPVRFGMYLSLQEYAREKLREMVGGEERGAEERHGKWYAGYGTEEALVALEGHGGVERRRNLNRELENLVTGCRRAIARRDWLTAVSTYCAAWAIHIQRGPLEVAVDLGRVLLGAELGREDRMRVLRALGDAERICGRMQDARAHQEAALAAARELGDRYSEGRILGSLGNLSLAQGRMEEARTYFQATLPILREGGDRSFEGAILVSLGMVYHRQGRMDEGRAHCEAALAINREVGGRRFEGITLGNLGILHREQGRIEEARAHFNAALAVHRELGDSNYEGAILNNLGGLYYEQGRVEDALGHYEAALTKLREVGDRLTEGIILGNLGILHREEGRAEEAQRDFEAALVIARDLGNRRIEGIALGNLGTLHREQGRLEDARVDFEAALANLREVGDRRGEGIFLGNLGSLHREQSRLESAEEALSRGESILREVGDPIELGKLLCARAELEQETGKPEAARATLREAEELAAKGGAGPESELGRFISKLRQALES